jgi:hypothetical protein
VLSLLASVGIFLAKPFGVQKELAARHPWGSLSKYMKNIATTELYGAVAYIAAGERKEGGC